MCFLDISNEFKKATRGKMSTDSNQQTKAVFVCSTVYHLLISLVKIMIGEAKSADIAILDSMPNAVQIIERLRKMRICEAFIFKNRELGNKWHPSELLYFDMLIRKKEYRKRFRPLTSYDEIFLFNDKDVCGFYFSANKIKYHLLEDGLDCYKIVDQYELRGRAKLLRLVAGYLFRFPLFLGWSKSCIDIEINDASNMKTALRRPVKVLPRELLFGRLNDTDIADLFDIFNRKPFRSIKNGVLLLTQPLVEMGVVKSESEQIEFFKKITDQFNADIYIKPHPRDNCSYEEITSPDAIFSKYFPVELLNYSGSYFDVAVTYASTALQSLTCAKVKYVCDETIANQELKLFPV